MHWKMHECVLKHYLKDMKTIRIYQMLTDALKFGKKLRCYILKKTFEKDHSNKYYKETYNTVVLKRLRNSLDTELLKIGLSDLLVEASILAQCSHPNIISIHAIGGDDTTYYDNQSNQLYNDWSIKVDIT